MRATERDLPHPPVVGLSQPQVTIKIRLYWDFGWTKATITKFLVNIHMNMYHIQPENEFVSFQAPREAGEHQQSLVGQAGLYHLTWVVVVLVVLVVSII